MSQTRHSKVKTNKSSSESQVSRAQTPPQSVGVAPLSLQATQADPAGASSQEILQLQRQYGNRAVQRLIQRAQAEIAQREAPVGLEGGEVGGDLQSQINSARGGGQPLDKGVGSHIGEAMGADFSGVKVHTDSQSDTLNRSLSAKAFTLGSDVFFSKGAYSPGTHSGQELLAHELTHVVQQGGGKTNKVQTKLTVGPAGDKYEEEADQMASQVMRMMDPAPAQASAVGLQKEAELPGPTIKRKIEGISAGQASGTLQLARGQAGRVGGALAATPLAAGTFGLLAPFMPLIGAVGGAGFAGKGVWDKLTKTKGGRPKQMSGAKKFGAGLLAGLAGIGGFIGGAIAGTLGAALLPIAAAIPGLMGDLSARMTFGFGSDRQEDAQESTADLNRPSRNKPYRVVDISITNAHTGEQDDNFVLRGRRYNPKQAFANGPGAGKAVILFSGSGGPNENQLLPLAEFYAKQGSTVFAVNYRGFGESRNKKKNWFGAGTHETTPFLSEEGLVKDAERIYTYVVAQNFVAGNIILHGFSLGGAIAAKLAKRLARNNIQLGGLVLHSSIKTAFQAAKGMVPLPGVSHSAGLITKMSAGSFDTPQALAELAQADANLPIHFMSGAGDEGDQLALSETGLPGLAGGFNNRSQQEGTGHHLTTSSHIDNTRQKNVLATLLSRGRNRDVNNLQQDQAVV